MLKKDDINSLPELLNLIRNHIPGHTNEPVRYAELMENIFDWKTFIEPHLFSSRSLEFIEVSKPHHFRFYQQNNSPHVQYKIYANNAWRPVDGEVYLKTIPDSRTKPGFAQVFQSESGEIAALQSFLSLKERQLERLLQLNVAEEQLQPYRANITDTQTFIAYLEEFPTRDRSAVHAATSFWCNVSYTEESSGGRNHVQEEDLDLSAVLPYFPNVEHRGYFGPRGKAPRQKQVRQPKIQEQKHGRNTSSKGPSKHASSGNRLDSNAVPIQQEQWYDFDPHMDVHVGDFVGVQAPEEAQRNGEVFWVAKVQ